MKMTKGMFPDLVIALKLDKQFEPHYFISTEMRYEPCFNGYNGILNVL